MTDIPMEFVRFRDAHPAPEILELLAPDDADMYFERIDWLTPIVKSVLLILGFLAATAAVIFVLSFGVPTGIYALLSIDWVTSGLFLAVFTFVVFRYGLHWGTEGAIVLVVDIGVMPAFLDFRGNPIYNLPYELLFLDDGHRLSFHVISESRVGEIRMGMGAHIIDSAGNVVSSPNVILVGLYRAIQYWILYTLVMTVTEHASYSLTTTNSWFRSVTLRTGKPPTATTRNNSPPWTWPAPSSPPTYGTPSSTTPTSPPHSLFGTVDPISS